MAILARVFLAVLATLLGAHAALACKVAPPMAPNIFPLATPNAEFVLAVVESPDSYFRFGYTPTEAQNDALDLYPVSGVYQIGRSPQLLWALERNHYPSAIHSFFSRDGRVYLVFTDENSLVFTEDGNIVRAVGRSELFSAPWQTMGLPVCGDPENIEVIGSTTGPRPTVRVKTDSETEFVFDAMTGETLSQRTPEPIEDVVATGDELQLAQTASQFVALATAQDWAAPTSDWSAALAPVSFEDCYSVPWDDEFRADLIGAAREDPENDAWTVRLFAWKADYPLDRSVPGLARIIVPGTRALTMYRVPAGTLLRRFCGADPLPTPLLATELYDEDGAAPQEYLDLAEALNESIVAIVSATNWEEDEERFVLGVTSFWTPTRQGWQAIGSRLFVAAPEERAASSQ